MSLWHKQREQGTHGENGEGGKSADVLKDVFSGVSLSWPLEPGECVQAVRGRGGGAGWMEWAIAMQTGQQRDRSYEDRWGRSGHTKTKTKRQIDCTALSSGGQLWLKQTRQTRQKTWTDHDWGKKNFEMKLTKWNVPGMLVIMQHFGWQREGMWQTLPYLKADSIPGAPSRHRRRRIFFRQHGGWSQWHHSQSSTGAQRSCSPLACHCSLFAWLTFLIHKHT